MFNFSDTTLELSVMPKDEDILQVVSFIQMQIVFLVMSVNKNSLKMEVDYIFKNSRGKNKLFGLFHRVWNSPHLTTTTTKSKRPFIANFLQLNDLIMFY